MNSGQFKKGLIYGVGVDDLDYRKEVRKYSGNTSKITWYCEAYSRWRNMLKRCYSSNTEKSYKGVTVCDSWLYFSNYKSWYDNQDKPNIDFDVDKDIMQANARVYSPETCVIIPRRLNTALGVMSKGLPGTYYERCRNKYQSYCGTYDGKRLSLGRYSTEHEAHKAWQKEKINQIGLLIEWYDGTEFKNNRVSSQLYRIMNKVMSELTSNVPTYHLKVQE